MFSDSFATFEEATEYRNEIYFLGYDNAKVITLKDGDIVDANKYMNANSNEKENAVFDITFEVQLEF